MKKVDVVIGAAYGDEGKGQTVYNLATPDSVVVRFNGGAQAGHTAEHEGVRHVHSHFGSGTMKGCATYLSRFFVCHPVMFKDEWEELAGKMDEPPKVFVSPDSFVTTPYDAILNVLGECHRGNDRHGSCGVGFGETIERYDGVHGAGTYKLTVGDLKDPDKVREVMTKIRDNWIGFRLQELRIADEHFMEGGKFERFLGVLKSDATIDRFVSECEFFVQHTTEHRDGWMSDLG